MQTDGATASAQALADGKADLAIIRGDLDVPKNAQAVATLRKNVAVLWVPPAVEGQRQEGRPEDHQNRAARRTPHRRRRPHPGQCQSAQGDPAAIRRRSGQGRDRSVSGHRSRRRDPQPEGRCLSRRRTGQQQDHRGCDRRIDARRRHADLPRDRFGRGDRAEPSRSTRPPKFPPAPSAARPTGPRKRSRRSASRTTSSRARICRKRPSPPSPGNCSRSGNR